MSIASELNNYRNGLDDAWDAAEDMGATIPHDRNMVNLDDAIRTIPVSSPNDGVLTITQNGVTIQTFSADQATNVTAALTDTTYSDFTGATSSVAGAAGLVPAPTTADPDKYLKGDGSWGTPTDTTYTAGTNVQISAQNVISATDTTYSNFTGATSSVAGAAGLVPAPAAGDEGKALHGDGTWKDTTAKLVEMSYGEANAWAKFIAAYNAGSIVYCRASSNANPGSGSQTRKAFMAYVNNATSPTSVEFQYVRSVSSKTDSQQCDQVFVYTLTNSNGGTWSVASRNMGPKINVSGPITKTFSNGANATITIGANAMTGATSSADGAAGVVPKPNSGDQDKVLTGAGTWAKVGNGNIDWSTMEHWTLGISGNQTVTQGSAYDYVDVPGTSKTLTMTVGGVYLVMINAAVKCVGNSTDCYARVLINGGAVVTALGYNPSSQYTAATSAQIFTATQASNTAKIQIGGGRANSDYTIAGDTISSAQIIRIA